MADKFKVGDVIRIKNNPHLYKITSPLTDLSETLTGYTVARLDGTRDYIPRQFTSRAVIPEEIQELTEVEKILYASIP